MVIFNYWHKQINNWLNLPRVVFAHLLTSEAPCETGFYTFIDPEDAETLVYAFITSRCHFNDVLFTELPLTCHWLVLGYSIIKTDRVLINTKQRAHVIPIFSNLPVTTHIQDTGVVLTSEAPHNFAPQNLSKNLSHSHLRVCSWFQNVDSPQQVVVLSSKLWNSISALEY